MSVGMSHCFLPVDMFDCFLSVCISDCILSVYMSDCFLSDGLSDCFMSVYMSDCFVSVGLSDCFLSVYMFDCLLSVGLSDCFLSVYMSDCLLSVEVSDCFLSVHMSDCFLSVYMSDCFLSVGMSDCFISVWMLIVPCQLLCITDVVHCQLQNLTSKSIRVLVKFVLTVQVVSVWMILMIMFTICMSCHINPWMKCRRCSGTSDLFCDIRVESYCLLHRFYTFVWANKTFQIGTCFSLSALNDNFDCDNIGRV